MSERRQLQTARRLLALGILAGGLWIGRDLARAEPVQVGIYVEDRDPEYFAFAPGFRESLPGMVKAMEYLIDERLSEADASIEVRALPYGQGRRSAWEALGQDGVDLVIHGVFDAPVVAYELPGKLRWSIRRPADVDLKSPPDPCTGGCSLRSVPTEVEGASLSVENPLAHLVAQITDELGSRLDVRFPRRIFVECLFTVDERYRESATFAAFTLPGTLATALRSMEIPDQVSAGFGSVKEVTEYCAEGMDGSALSATRRQELRAQQTSADFVLAAQIVEYDAERMEVRPYCTAAYRDNYRHPFRHYVHGSAGEARELAERLAEHIAAQWSEL